MRANALLNYRLLRSSVNDSVVVGGEDWLYFADTVPDYTGDGRLSDAELDAIRDTLRALADAHAEHGARLYIAVVPNKSTIYPQFMPDRYAMRGDGGNIALLEQACASLPVTWIDLVTPLREAAAGERPVYYRTDTHWNALGAAIAARTVLAAMGRETVQYEAIGETEFSGGDLARLMGVPGDLIERVPEVIPGETLPDADFSAHRFTCEGPGEGKLLVYRDSFGTAVGPWLSQAYAESEFRWESPLDASRRCDDALLLICEHNLREYLCAPPFIDETDEAEEEDEDDFVPADEDDDFFSDDNPSQDDDFFSDESDEEDFVPADEDDDFFDDGAEGGL